jgi:hypothetical protein
VVSLHRQGFLALFAGSYLLSFTVAPCGLHPWSIILSALPCSSPLLGQPLQVLLGKEPPSGPPHEAHMYINASRAKIISLHIEAPALAGPGCAIVVARALPILEEELRLQGWPSVHFQCHLPPMPAREEKTLASWLVGRGEGLTPEGDDVLVGLLAALEGGHALSPAHAQRRQRLVAALAQMDLRQHTTKFSAQLLETACRGEYYQPLVELFATLGAADAALRRACQELVSLGHSSGRALLWGVHWVLKQAST